MHFGWLVSVNSIVAQSLSVDTTETWRVLKKVDPWRSCWGRPSCYSRPDAPAPCHDRPCNGRPDATVPAASVLLWPSSHVCCDTHPAATTQQAPSLAKEIAGGTPDILVSIVAAKIVRRAVWGVRPWSSKGLKPNLSGVFLCQKGTNPTIKALMIFWLFWVVLSSLLTFDPSVNRWL